MYKLQGRIDSSNANTIEQAVMEARPTEIDASELEYISSAGLRVLLKLTKEVGEVTVVNVSSEVYDIFEMTGFTNILNVRKAIREVSVDGCELIGQGGNGSVYRLDEDAIVKVYTPKIPYEQVEKEREFAKTAFINGIPSVIAYDTVKCGDSYGLVFEMIKSDTLGHTMRDNPEKLQEYVAKHVQLAKTLHSTHISDGSFTNIKEVLHQRVPVLKEWCSAEELQLLDSLIDCMPDKDTIIHNDLHPGNIMIQNGELLLIDMPEVTTGPTMYDLVGIFRDMISAPRSTPEVIEKSVGMPADMIVRAGQMFFSMYTGITDPAELEGLFKKLGLVYALNVCLTVAHDPDKAARYAPAVMEKLLRGVIIPNEQALRAILASM